MRIWKFPLAIDPCQQIEMPEGARILSVQVQHNLPCIWALVDPNASPVTRRFDMFGTGGGFTHEPGPHIGTVLLRGGDLVMHIFEVVP